MNKSIQYCSFCGKSQADVETMIVGGDANICSECVDFSVALVTAYRAGKLDGSSKEKTND